MIRRARAKVAWEDRPKVTIDVTPETTTAELMVMAGRALNLKHEDGGRYGYGDDGVFEPHISRIAFYSETSKDHFAELETILDEDGAVQWAFEPTAVKFAQILEAHEQGLLPGDPARVYFTLDHQAAGGGLWDIAAIGFGLQVLQNALTVHGAVSATRDTYSIVQKFREWFVLDIRARQTLKRYKTIFAVPRTTAQVATLLTVSEDDVPTICHFLGMQFIDRAWRPVNTPQTKEFNELIIVLDDAIEWDLNEHFTKKAFAEILGLPVGSRFKGTDSIIRKMRFEQAEGL